MCILLVEDEALIREVLAEELAEAGFDVCEAESGDRALALIGAQTPDAFSALVTDVHMPGSLSGIEVATLLRARRPDIPVVYMTGRPDVLGGTGPLGSRTALLPKPFVPSKLLAVVRRLLGTAGSEVPGS